jgi:hypothetical protein
MCLAYHPIADASHYPPNNELSQAVRRELQDCSDDEDELAEHDGDSSAELVASDDDGQSTHSATDLVDRYGEALESAVAVGDGRKRLLKWDAGQETAHNSLVVPEHDVADATCCRDHVLDDGGLVSPPSGPVGEGSVGFRNGLHDGLYLVWWKCCKEIEGTKGGSCDLFGTFKSNAPYQ